MRKAIATLLLCSATLGLAGCETVGDVVPSGLKFFGPKEEILPGERHAALASSDPTAVDEKAAAVPVSLPAPAAIGDWAQPGGNASNSPGNLAVGGGGFSTSVALSGSNSRVGFGGGLAARKLSVSPISYQGGIYVMDSAATVTALGGGGRSWSTSLKPEGEKSGGGFGGGLAGDNGRIFAATGYGKVHALDASNGAVLWTHDLESPARSAPTVTGGRVYLVSSDNVIHSLSVDDGTEIWSYRGIPETAGLLSTSSPAVSGNRVVVPYSSGEIIAFDTAKGEPVWGDQLTGGSRFSAVSGLRDVAGSPVISNGTVYAVGVGGRMVAVAEKNGERLWARNIASSQTPVVAGNSVFLVTLNGDLLALDRATGNVRWKTALPGAGTSWSGPVLANSQLWLGASDGRILTANAVNGQIVGSTKSSGPIYVRPIAANGSVVFIDDNGRVTGVN
ncbi:MAG: PQQ-binding-like beta-propeller repeat protein [Rhodobiaceae bacterium]|nr:PQQ-binding-like beta-propeller repeat protein [Rhodobiaceae bacterium]MCC0056525.1 PQQ-binding-like beta-propeller repeat protein [Rhodobiaceae bacterium]